MSDFYSKYFDLVKQEKNKYKGAGFIFYRKSKTDFEFLLGLDNKSNTNTLSVCGGGREETDKNSLYTACRETFEELFNVLPGGLDIFVNEIQKKINNDEIVEKIFMKNNNEICYFAEVNILNMFINHLYYQKSPWTFKDTHEWNEYIDNIPSFINDRILKNNQKAKNGLNEIKKVLLLKWSVILKSFNNVDNKLIIINKKKYQLRDNLNKYLQENIIIDIIYKNINT